MTDEQITELLVLLDRIAVALEPKIKKPVGQHISPNGKKRMDLESVVEEKIQGMVKDTALKKK